MANRKSLRRFLNPADNCWHVQVIQGDSYVSSDPLEILTTVLGSCIAACIRDPEAGLGGMNHFLLPSSKYADRDAARYGVNAMELLINNLLKKGGARHRFEAKLFGGANVIPGLSDVGSANVIFAQKFLADEGIRLVGGDVRGKSARRIQYWPVSGRALQRSMPTTESFRLAESEITTAEQKFRRDRQEARDVELF